MNSPPTVAIVDSQPTLRRCWTAWLDSMRLRAEAYASAQEWLKAGGLERPGCLLLEVRPGPNDLDLLARLAREPLHPQIIAVSACAEVPLAVRAMKAGAIHFLVKPCRNEELRQVVEEALARDAAGRRRRKRRLELRRRMERLTNGQRRVLKLLVQGESNKDIAAALGLSVRAIEVRRSKVMKKMQAGSLAKLVRLTLAAGRGEEKHSDL